MDRKQRPMDRKRRPMDRWNCEHPSPIVVEEVEEGKKKVARCLRCGQSGPVRQGAEEALQALREQQPRDHDPRGS